MQSEVPAEWSSSTVNDAMEAIIDYRGKTPRKVAAGIPLVTAKVIKKGRINTPTEFVAVDEYDDWMRRGLPIAGDVLITTEAPMGEVAQLRTARVALAQRVILLRGKKQLLNNTFLKFLLQSSVVQDQLRARESGTTVTGIKQKELRKVQLPLPPLPEQRRIAAVLGALDDKIELNRKMNQTLEEMAQALFKSWFIDFDGHDPADLVDSELGPIPRGWGVRSIYDVATVVYGAPFKSKLFNEDGIGMPLIRNRDLKTQSPGKFTTEEHPKAHAINPGDIVVSMDAEFRPHIWVGPVSLLNQRVCTFIPLPEVPPAFLFFAVIEPLRFWERAKTGTTVIHLGKKDINKIELVVPPQATLDDFGKVVGRLIERQVANHQQASTLADLRDALLPKLISGEIRVPEAEAAVGAVA